MARSSPCSWTIVVQSPGLLWWNKKAESWQEELGRELKIPNHYRGQNSRSVDPIPIHPQRGHSSIQPLLYSLHYMPGIEPCDINMRTSSSKMAVGKGTYHQALVQTLGPTWWKYRTDPHKLSSDLHMSTVVCTCVNTLTNTFTQTHSHTFTHTNTHSEDTHSDTHTHTNNKCNFFKRKRQEFVKKTNK